MNVLKDFLRLPDKLQSLGGRDPGARRDGTDKTLITPIEERLGIMVNDSDIDGRMFASVAALVNFVPAGLIFRFA